MRRSGDDASAVRTGSDASSAAWKRTVEDMRSLAEGRREDGWEVVDVPAVHTDAVGRGQDDERFGLVHVIADNHADDVRDAFERGDFVRFEAYRNETAGEVFLVTELLDPERSLALLIASAYDRRRVGPMVRSATNAGVCYTHAKTLDGTPLGRVRHEEWAPLVPDDALPDED